MAFCQKCGNQLQDGMVACPNCGNFVNPQQPQYPQQTQYNPYNQNPNMVYVKPKIPGRGLGIASMVLAIIGLVFAFGAFVDAMGFLVTVDNIETVDKYGSWGSADADMVRDVFVSSCVIYSVLSVLGVSLGSAGRNKGYRNGVSMSGVIMGIIGMVLFLIAGIVVATV